MYAGKMVHAVAVETEALAGDWPWLQCPACKADLAATGTTSLRCRCGKSYPLVEGKPVLIDEAKSIFAHAEYRHLTAAPPPTRIAKMLRKLPALSVNLAAVKSFATMRDLLAAKPDAVVLVVGGGVIGKGIRMISDVPGLRLLNVDPAPSSSAEIFCDGHDLPFRDGTFDAVIVQAVLEHVCDAERCVAEIHRVLKHDALVYSETPFMQQVHMKGVDFVRYTHVGHRRLFRNFAELESGVVAGPGTALAWSWRYFLASLSTRPWLANALYQAGRVTGTGFELMDHLIRQRPGALDAASCTYFLGRRSTDTLSDRDTLATYRGQRQS
jgi:SAM-dependent methyltransferase